MRARSLRPSPALVVALVALVVAMTGTAWAVAQNSVGTNQLKDGAVTAPKLHQGAVTSLAVKDGALKIRDFSKEALVGPGLLDRGPLTDFRLAPGQPVTSTQLLTFTAPAGKTLLISDVIFQNPSGDLGRVELRRNAAVLMQLNLSSFSTQQQRFATPLKFKSGEKVGFLVQCQNPTGGCTPSAFFIGVLAS
jgi:hypothetical protein